MRRRNLMIVIITIFVLAGIVLAWTHGFEHWAGRALERAAPAARREIPAPAKRVLRETRERLPVYGSTSTWVARKSASIVYFGGVGLFVLALRRRTASSLGETLLVTVAAAIGMSAIIEIVEFPEELADVVFDLGCGAFGGIVAGLIGWTWICRHSKRRLGVRVQPRPSDL